MNSTLQTDLSKLDDRQLIDLFHQKQDEEAFGLLVQRHGPMVSRVCQRTLHQVQESEDAYQAVFLVLARRAGNVKWEKCLASWLYGVALRICLKANRQLQKRPQLLGEQDAFTSDNSSAHAEISEEAEQALYEELGRLSKKLQEPVILCSLEGLSRTQAAETLGVKETTLNGRMERARELLRRRLLRREIVLPAAMLSGGLLPTTAEAGFSTSLVFSPAAVTTQFTSGATVSGQLGATAVHLAQGELAAMLMITKLKGLMVGLCLVLIIGGGSCYFLPGLTDDSQSPETGEQMTETPQLTVSEEDFRKMLIGEWQVLEVIEEQGENGLPPGHGIDFIFDQDRITMLTHEPHESGRKTHDQPMEYQLVFNQVPIGIDMQFQMKDINSDETMVRKFPGIIEIKEDILRIQLNRNSDERPKAFTNLGMFVAKKVKPGAD